MSSEQSTDSSRPEQVLGSFASLLSSALTANGETPESLTAAASNLPRLISTTVLVQADCFTIPCLMLKHSDSALRKSTSSSLEETAALYLARPLNVTREELEALPIALLGNVSESFMSLVDSRLRSSLLALMRQQDAQQETSITRSLVGLLASTESPIAPTTVVTTFRILPACEKTQSDDTYVAPLIMETVIDLTIISRQLVTITFVAPGTIQGSFSSLDGFLTKVDVNIDTEALLRSMMDQARSAVREAIVIASGVVSTLLVSPPKENNGSSTARDILKGASNLSSKHGGVCNAHNSEDGQGSANMVPHAPRHQLPLQGGGALQGAANQAQVTESREQEQIMTTGNGLSLLTAAAVGMKPSAVAPSSSNGRSAAQPRNMSTSSNGGANADAILNVVEL